MGTSKATFRRAEYGGGSVMLWDRGTFDLIGPESGAEQIERGDLKFELHGEKLRGTWALVHMKNRVRVTSGYSSRKTMTRPSPAGTSKTSPKA